jgi:hypothetical protein
MVVGMHLDDEKTPTRAQRSRCFGQHPFRLGHVVQDETEDRCVELAISDWQGLEATGPDIDVRQGLQPGRRGLEHRL